MSDEPKLSRPALVGYGVLVVLIALGFLQVQATQAQLEGEVRIRQQLTCNSYNQLENIIREMVVNVTTVTRPIPEDASPALRKLLEDSRQRNIEFRAYVEGLLEEADCPALVGG